MDDGDIAEINKIVQEIGMKYDGRGLSMKTGDVYPTNNAPVLALQNGKPSLSLMKWGYPKWDGKGVIINAKSETATEKRMFSAALSSRRCIIPSTGFYEWTQDKGQPKIKYRFNTPDSPMLYLAGLYSEFNLKENDEPLKERFVILTRESNADIQDIHHRMPVILYKDEIIRWLTNFDYAKIIMERDTVSLVSAIVNQKN